jgi:Domain of unknown function (DUF6379)
VFDEHIISGETMRPRSDGVPGARLHLRLPWYRGLPLSCIERIEIAIDGEEVPRDEISFSLFGYDHALDDLRDLHKVVWYTLDTADVRVRTKRPLLPGDHDVDVTVQTRIPYAPVAERAPFTPVARCSKRLALVREED